MASALVLLFCDNHAWERRVSAALCRKNRNLRAEDKGVLRTPSGSPRSQSRAPAR